MTIALMVIDVQHDFLPGGALGIAHAGDIIPTIQTLAKQADLVIATRDFHPADHSSFIANGGQWPPHCIQGTPGAELHPAIASLAQCVVDKGVDREIDGASGFMGTKLDALLKEHGVTELWIVGLATDVCVKATVLDGRDLGWSITVFEDGIKGVNIHPEDSADALVEMERAGAQVRSSRALSLGMFL